MPEDTVKDSKQTQQEKDMTVAYSMKLVNGVYNKLINVFTMQIKEDEIDEYIMGWNDAFKAVVNMVESCKYTKEDYLNLIKKEDDADETPRG